MNLQEKLAGLYADRADLLQHIDQIKNDPTNGDKIVSAIDESKRRGERPEASLLHAMFAATPINASIDDLKSELAWTERQICAILTNPALVTP